MNLEECGKRILAIFNNANYEAYIVGGYVRDKLLNLNPNDMDIATSALPADIGKLFDVKQSAMKYNSITICYLGYEVEVTTFRIEHSYKDQRHPEYSNVLTYKEDVYRRDFTINALAYDSTMVVVDYIGGLKDLSNKEIKTINNPIITFTDDPLRILRGFYLIGKLDFVFEKQTYLAVKQTAHLLQKLSVSRKYHELQKISTTTNSLKGFEEILKTNSHIYLGLKKTIKYIVDNKIIISSMSELLLIGCYFKEDFINWNLQKELINPIVDAVNLQGIINNELLFYNGLKRCLLKHQLDCFLQKKVYDENYIIEQYNKLPITKISDLKIRGMDIINLYPTVNPKDINKIINLIVINLLNYNIKNEYNDIISFLNTILK